jgi:hypothetical protein
MKNRTRFVLVAALGFALCWGTSVSIQAEAQAKTAMPLEGVKFDTSISMTDNLKTYVNKDVILHLRSGKTLQGYVRSVGNGLIHLEKLAGKDFYDALVRIEDVSAIEAKLRDMK